MEGRKKNHKQGKAGIKIIGGDNLGLFEEHQEGQARNKQTKKKT